MPDPDLSTLPLISSSDELATWLAANGETESEYWVKFHKKTSPGYSVDLPR